MADDGSGGSEYGQQPPYSEQQPQQPPPYEPPPPYAPPPPYVQQSPYASGPYGQPQWGQPDATQEFTGIAPQYAGMPVEAPANGGSRRAGLWVASIVVLLAVLAVGGYFVFHSDTASASDPREPVRKLLDAGKRGDIGSAKEVLCKRDTSNAAVDALRSAGNIKTYTINNARQIDSTHAVVNVTVTTTLLTTPTTVPFPAVKEGGTWKACPDLSEESGSGAATSPSVNPSYPPVSIGPSVPGVGDLNPCDFATTAQNAAVIYVGAAETGQTDVAQACVFRDSVPRSVTADLQATGAGIFAPAPSGSHGSTFAFDSVDGQHHLTVTVTKEPDGHLYITHVEKS